MRTSIAAGGTLAALAFCPLPAVAQVPAAEVATETGLDAAASRGDGAAIDRFFGGDKAALQARDAHCRTPGRPPRDMHTAAPPAW
jgi:hypothetical protein